MSDLVSEARTRVLKQVEDSSSGLVEFLSHYVRFPSINPDMLDDRQATRMRECQEWLCEQAGQWGVFDEARLAGPDPDQPNLLARRRGQGQGNALMFTGHSDVVPVTAEQVANWTKGSPFGGEVLEGRLWGRGASDMKGGNAAFLWAIKCLGEAGVRLQGDVLASCVSGEETGNHSIGVDVLDREGYVAPFAVLAEPTSLGICPASIGEFYFLIRVEGKSASLASRHLYVNPGAYGAPVAGVNAIDKMWKIQQALMQLDREWAVWQRHPLMVPGNMNINFSRIHAGETYSAMAESCELTGSVLFNPSLRFKDVVAEFRRTIDGVGQSDYWLREHPPVLTIPYVLDQKEPINLSVDHPGTVALINACREVLKNSPGLGCTTGTSDGNYAFARGQDIITFGPGDGDAGVHGPNEFISVDQLIQAAKVYAVMAIDWCGVASITS
jgi:formylaminopyrimidine deformylase